MDVLSIGNSFSNDGQRYLNQIAKADGVHLGAYNLYIGGCSLSMHYRNVLKDAKAYNLVVNGANTGFKVSIEEALLNRDWDVITFQQASGWSTKPDSYQPYLDEIVALARKCCPKAKIVIHQTWAYEQDSEKLEKTGYGTRSEMFADIKKAYKKAAAEIGADMVIPSGEVFEKLLASGVESVQRDTFHASYGLGRYALGLTWYKILTGNDISGNTFCDFDEEVTPEQMELAKKCVAEVCEKYENQK